MKRIFNSITIFAIATLFLPACGTAPSKNDGTLNVLASTTFLADIAQNIAGNRAEVNSLVPAGADPHEYQPAPSDVAKIAASNVLILNGLEYESFIQPLLTTPVANALSSQPQLVWSRANWRKSQV